MMPGCGDQLKSSFLSTAAKQPVTRNQTVQVPAMCQKDSWYVENEQWCFNPVAHAILCGVLITIALLCTAKGLLVFPHLLPRARRILCLYIATELSVVFIEVMGLVYLKIDTFALRIVRLIAFATFAALQYWSSVSRTHFFLEAVASTQNCLTPRWTFSIKVYLAVILTIYSSFVFIMLAILPAVLPNSMRYNVWQAALVMGGSLYLAVAVPTAVIGYRLVVLIQAVVKSTIALGGTQPTQMSTLNETLVMLREGLIKSLLSLSMATVLCYAGAGFGVHWFFVHLMVACSQIGFLGAVSYLQTCKKPHDLPNITSYKSHDQTTTRGEIIDIDDSN